MEVDQIPVGWSTRSADFVNRCLKLQSWERIGYNEGVEELKNDPWFNDFDWEALRRREIKSPCIININEKNFREKELKKGWEYDEEV